MHHYIKKIKKSVKRTPYNNTHTFSSRGKNSSGKYLPATPDLGPFGQQAQSGKRYPWYLESPTTSTHQWQEIKLYLDLVKLHRTCTNFYGSSVQAREVWLCPTSPKRMFHLAGVRCFACQLAAKG